MGLAAGLLKLVIELLAEDEVKRLSSAWLDQITDTYTDLLADELAIGDLSGVNGVLAGQAHADLIAKTEINRGKNAGTYEAYRSQQVRYVVWITTSPNPCQECLDNQAAGRWPLGKPFPSGVICPPDHPQCECHLEPA